MGFAQQIHRRQAVVQLARPHEKEVRQKNVFGGFWKSKSVECLGYALYVVCQGVDNMMVFGGHNFDGVCHE